MEMEHILCYLTIDDTNRLCTNPKHALGMCEDQDIAPGKKHETNSGAFLQLNHVSISSFNIGEKVYCRSLNHFETQNTGLY
jgi:hypothetical protein